MSKGFTKEELKDLGLKGTSGISWRGPIELYGTFVELARQAFSDSGFSQKLRWDADPLKSGIHIVPGYLWDDATVEKRPLVYIELGELKCIPRESMAGTGLVGMNMQGEHGSEYSNSVVVGGAVSFNAVGETRGETLSIANDLFRYLCIFAQPIRSDFCFSSFTANGISPLTVVKEARERLQCAVSATFGYEYSWTIVEEGPKAKIDLHINQNG